MLRFVLKCKQQRRAENVFDFVRKASYKVKIRLVGQNCELTDPFGQNCEWVRRTLLENCEEPFVIVNGSVKRYQLKKEKNRCDDI